jgi:hypothetical protein
MLELYLHSPIIIDQLRLFTLKYDLLKISVDLRTTFAAETHLAEGQWLKEQLIIQFSSLLLMCHVNSSTPITDTAQCTYW